MWPLGGALGQIHLNSVFVVVYYDCWGRWGRRRNNNNKKNPPLLTIRYRSIRMFWISSAPWQCCELFFFFIWSTSRLAVMLLQLLEKKKVEVGLLVLIIVWDCSGSSSWKWNVIPLPRTLKPSRKPSSIFQCSDTATSQSNRVSCQKVYEEPKRLWCLPWSQWQVSIQWQHCWDKY